MNSKDYWEQRERETLKHRITDEKEYEKQIKQIYANMLANVETEINAFYGKYAAKNGITIAEAEKAVKTADIAAYKFKAKQYVKNKDFSRKANEEMALYNLTMKVNRLEMLKANIGLEMIDGHNELEKFMKKILQGRTTDELKRQAGILGKTVQNNAKTAHTIVNASFHNATFSDRIWQYQDLMKNQLASTLQTGLIQGKNPRAIAGDLRRYWYGNDPRTGKGAVYCMERLMRTELARVQIEAQKQSFEENGFEEYTFHTNTGCCDICAKLDGKHFKVKDMQPGLNAAPMHPNCRCSVSAYEDSEEYENWIDFLANGGTTEEYNRLKAKGDTKQNDILKRIKGTHTREDDAAATNPKFSEGGEYSINCQRCVQAYEFRRRGYDVEAMPKPLKGNTVLWGSECFIKPGENAMKAYQLGLKVSDVKQTLKNAPDGARYSVYVKWKGRNGSAHVFIAEKENGGIIFVDPQTGKTDVARYFNLGSPGRYGLFRLDDKEITTDMDIIKATVKEVE